MHKPVTCILLNPLSFPPTPSPPSFSFTIRCLSPSPAVSQVAIISPFNFPLEIPLLQLMGALYMGNKPTLKVDSKVRKSAPVLGS